MFWPGNGLSGWRKGKMVGINDALLKTTILKKKNNFEVSTNSEDIVHCCIKES